jgi:hypothetical protein
MAGLRQGRPYEAENGVCGCPAVAMFTGWPGRVSASPASPAAAPPPPPASLLGL